MDAPRVLVVEDFNDAREMFVDLFSLAGFDVCQARDGVEAIATATAVVPHIILMDLGLPRMDGWSAASAIKQGARTSHIPIVALTAFTDERLHQRALDAGCVHVATKPCEPDRLLAIIAAVIDGTPI
jgi:CheY-like chemotaxis protein